MNEITIALKNYTNTKDIQELHKLDKVIMVYIDSFYYKNEDSSDLFIHLKQDFQNLLQVYFTACQKKTNITPDMISDIHNTFNHLVYYLENRGQNK